MMLIPCDVVSIKTESPPKNLRRHGRETGLVRVKSECRLSASADLNLCNVLSFVREREWRGEKMFFSVARCEDGGGG
jgi:hypothetical protein